MTTRQPVAAWLPDVLRDAPDDLPGAPRLLDALLEVIDRQRELLAADVDQVLDDVFIETCADWAVPYIGALLGLPAEATRLEVAYAVSLRRRKGTPRALEDFVRAVTGWTGMALEGRRLTVWAQRLDYPGGLRPAAADLRAMARRGGDSLFAPWLRSVTPGRRWSPRAVAAVVWPWTLRTYNRTQAVPLSPRRYALHPFGLDAPLYVRPQRPSLGADEPQPAQRASAAGPAAAPVRATWEVLATAAPGGAVTGADVWQLVANHPLATPADDSVPPPLVRLYAGERPLPWSAIRFASITSESAPPPPGVAYVDPLRGHVQLGEGIDPAVRAVWHRPQSGALGATGADMPRNIEAELVIVVDPTQPASDLRVPGLAAAMALAQDVARRGPAPREVEIRLETSDTIAAGGPYRDGAGIGRWRIVAPAAMSPTVSGALAFDLSGVELSLEGLRLDGDLRLGARLSRVALDGITMNPAAGTTLSVDPGAWLLRLEASRSILAPIRADLAAAPIILRDCIVDGLGRPLRACGGVAAPPTARGPRAAVDRADRYAPVVEASACTFAGRVAAEAADAVDTIFVDGVVVADASDGCLRHCYLGPGTGATPLTADCLTAPPPVFVTDAFEAGGYYALALDADQPLLTGAGDGGEVGAYHHARRAVSLARLRTRIHEFVPLGLDAEVVLASWEES